MTEQSFSVEVAWLNQFEQELTTQLAGITAPMNQLAAQSGRQPRFGAFPEAWTLSQSQQAAIQQVSELIGQISDAIQFAQNVTSSIATTYSNADQNVAASYGAPSTTAAPQPGTTTSPASSTPTTPTPAT
jgi:hypothetical protein